VELVDIHCHLDLPQFSRDLEEVVARCVEKGVVVVNNGIGFVSNRETLRLASEHSDVVRPALGFHPTEVVRKKLGEKQVLEEVEWIRENIGGVVAIGEVGLDYHWTRDKAVWDTQEKVFRAMIGVANEYRLPLVVHSRKAERRVLEVLDSQAETEVVMHSFGGGAELIRKALDQNFFFSIPPSIVRSKTLRKLARIVPIEKIFFESDAPFLSPNPGERNEPVNISVIAMVLSGITGVAESEIREKVLENTKRVFRVG